MKEKSPPEVGMETSAVSRARKKTDVALHDTYLRFSAEETLQHFAEVRGGADRSKYPSYFANSIAFADIPAPAGGSADVRKHAARVHQMEKDERFWITDTLMTLFHRAGDRSAAFARLLETALPDSKPPTGFATWLDALGPADDLRLYFEVNLPAPSEYKAWLGAHLGERCLVPWLRDPALASGKKRLEGSTKADAVLISATTHVAVVFEAKVLSDTSVQIGYDAARNQLARTIDVMLERNPHLMPPLDTRDPDLTYFVLMTPRLFKDDPSTRLYGWLMNAYRKDLEVLARHLPHRANSLPTDLPARLGWTTWEDCRQLFPDTAPWLVGQSVS